MSIYRCVRPYVLDRADYDTVDHACMGDLPCIAAISQKFSAGLPAEIAKYYFDSAYGDVYTSVVLCKRHSLWNDPRVSRCSLHCSQYGLGTPVCIQCGLMGKWYEFVPKVRVN